MSQASEARAVREENESNNAFMWAALVFSAIAFPPIMFITVPFMISMWVWAQNSKEQDNV